MPQTIPSLDDCKREADFLLKDLHSDNHEVSTRAVERFRREHKRLPHQVEFAALGLPVEVLIDPLNGEPFSVRERFGPMRDELPFVIYGGGLGPDEPDKAE